MAKRGTSNDLRSERVEAEMFVKIFHCIICNIKDDNTDANTNHIPCGGCNKVYVGETNITL